MAEIKFDDLDEATQEQLIELGENFLASRGIIPRDRETAGRQLWEWLTPITASAPSAEALCRIDWDAVLADSDGPPDLKKNRNSAAYEFRRLRGYILDLAWTIAEEFGLVRLADWLSDQIRRSECQTKNRE